MSNKKYSGTFFSVVLIFILFITGCKDAKKSQFTDTPLKGTIHISVDESFRPVIDAQIKVYEGSYPGTKIVADYKPETECFKDFYQDTANRMIIVTRGLTKTESRFYTDSLGYTPVSDRIAADAIAVVVNKNSTDTLFTIEGLKQLLLGKGDKKQKVVFDGLTATSTFRYVTDSILRGAAFDTGVGKAVKNSKDVLDFIAADENAIGLVGISWIGNPEEPEQVQMLKKIKIAYVQCSKCNDSPYVKPSQEGIVTRRYPLVRSLYYIVKENFSGLGSGFAEFLKYERGQLIFRRAYLAPVMDFEIRSVKINEKL